MNVKPPRVTRWLAQPDPTCRRFFSHPAALFIVIYINTNCFFRTDCTYYPGICYIYQSAAKIFIWLVRSLIGNRIYTHTIIRYF